jgi:hypothetical protein
MVERDIGQITAHRTEGVHVRPPFLVPVDEFDAEFERALRLPQEVVLVDFDQPVERGDGGNGGLAHADDADLGRLHQRDVEPRSEHARDGRGRHPAGGAPTRDNYRPDFAILHGAKHRTKETPAGLCRRVSPSREGALRAKESC